MSEKPTAPLSPVGVFTQGSTMRHVLRMTAAGSVGLIAIFAVDFLSLLYVSRLGDPNLTAAVGYATQVLFFTISINIGLSIAVGATVSRALGMRDKPAAQRLAASSLIHVAVVSVLTSILLLIFRRDLLMLIGAQGVPLDVANSFLAITLPANLLLGLGMALSGILRGVGDAKRAMYITLLGGLTTAVMDPLLIFGLGLGVHGAAIATVISRVVFVSVGLYGAVYVHGLVARPTRKAVISDLKPIMAIAVPAILTNLASPVALSFSLRIMSQFGEQAVAAFAINDRIAPVAFGVLFALSSAVGPIMGQNLGARNFDRVRQTLTDCLVLTGIYSFAVWLVLLLAAPYINALFGAKGETAELVTFFCTYGVIVWLFLGGLFVANAAFNNLGFPLLSTAFNWGRATLGTIPFVMLGAHYYGPKGAMAGIIVGAAIFGTAAILTAYYVTGRLAKRSTTT